MTGEGAPMRLGRLEADIVVPDPSYLDEEFKASPLSD